MSCTNPLHRAALALGLALASAATLAATVHQDFTAPGSAYGSMGTLVLLLVWMYYAAVVFFVGAMITAVLDERRRARRKARGATTAVAS